MSNFTWREEYTDSTPKRRVDPTRYYREEVAEKEVLVAAIEWATNPTAYTLQILKKASHRLHNLATYNNDPDQ